MRPAGSGGLGVALSDGLTRRSRFLVLIPRGLPRTFLCEPLLVHAFSEKLNSDNSNVKRVPTGPVEFEREVASTPCTPPMEEGPAILHDLVWRFLR
jgi:hypothetical protein